MTVIDIIKIICLIAVSSYAACSDIKTGIIKNKYLLIAFAAGLALDIIGWSVFERESFIVQAVNISVLCGLSFLMYLLHIWAGGDCKLAVVISLFVPFSFYPSFFGKWYALVLFMAVAFVFSYFYLIADSVVYAVKRKKVVSPKKALKGVANFVLRCVVNLSYIILSDSLLLLAFPKVFSDSRYLIIALNICLVLIISGFKVLANKYLVAAIILADVIICTCFNLHMINKWMLISYLTACITLLFRLFIDEYNYDFIETKEVKKGMILSASTVLAFANSHVKGLPTSTTEDLRSRLTQEEAESVHRWEKSKYGCETVQIVRKVPFAIFISLGAVSFLIVGGIFK